MYLGEGEPGLGPPVQVVHSLGVLDRLPAEVNGLAKEWMPEGNRVVLVSAPQKPNTKIPDEAQLAAAIRNASVGLLAAYNDTTTTKPFFAATPRTGSVTKTNVRADVGITEWTLSNGVKVVLKPKTFKQDEVMLKDFSPGGTSLVGDDDLIWAESAATLLTQRSGL